MKRLVPYRDSRGQFRSWSYFPEKHLAEIDPNDKQLVELALAAISLQRVANEYIDVLKGESR